MFLMNNFNKPAPATAAATLAEASQAQAEQMAEILRERTGRPLPEVRMSAAAEVWAPPNRLA